MSGEQGVSEERWLAFLDTYRTKCLAPPSGVLDELVRLKAV